MSTDQRPFLGTVLDHPRAVHATLALLTVSLAVLAALPTLWKPAATVLSPLRVDTDPENMLDEDVPVRVFHREMKERFHIYDMVVVGVENPEHPEGVFNVESLGRIHDLTRHAKTLRWPVEGEPGVFRGVVDHELLAPSTVDDIQPGDLGSVRFSWLMAEPPTTEAQALAVRESAARLPMLDGTLVSEDGKAVALYLPLTEKDVAHEVARALEEHYAAYGGPERFHVTGLPVAEDTFGIEMFIQMAISAPVAMVVIAVLLFVFFRRLMLVVPPLLVAFVTVIQTMGLLVVCGQTIHIMSSMIPIFIMPIAVLDAIHIISEFFDRQGEGVDRRATVLGVMRTLWRPMLFTSLTTAAGFASLALTPIPPVQVFGVFVAIGVLLAWLWTMTFIPVLLVSLPDRMVLRASGDRAGQGATPLGRALEAFGRFTVRRGKLILVLAGASAALAVFGISKIRVNDNPTMWFERNHPIRVADRMLNAHFGGTYMAHLVLEPAAVEEGAGARVRAELAARAASAEDGSALGAAFAATVAEFDRLATGAAGEDPLAGLQPFVEGRADAAGEDTWPAWEEVALFVGNLRAAGRLFEQPDALRRVAALQEHLLGVRSADDRPLVGKSSSLADIVKTVHRELYQSAPEAYRVPDSQAAVAQTLLTYQSSHRPRDLSHFVSPDAGQACLWIQLKSGDNQDMIRVVDAVDEYLAGEDGGPRLEARWFGLTYINMVWQEEMVAGMSNALLGSFAIVLLMMVLLFRSLWWGILSMIPLTLTIALIYGIIGLIGKDYDMPVTVLSSLSLGLAVDYAIHFLERARAAHRPGTSWSECVGGLFEEPARAIARNAIVVGLGFLPLLLAPLVPYQTVGALIAVILLTAGLASLGVLPALIAVMERLLFPSRRVPSED